MVGKLLVPHRSGVAEAAVWWEFLQQHCPGLGRASRLLSGAAVAGVVHPRSLKNSSLKNSGSQRSGFVKRKPPAHLCLLLKQVFG